MNWMAAARRDPRDAGRWRPLAVPLPISAEKSDVTITTCVGEAGRIVCVSDVHLVDGGEYETWNDALERAMGWIVNQKRKPRSIHDPG
jgi:hypothetical protein